MSITLKFNKFILILDILVNELDITSIDNICVVILLNTKFYEFIYLQSVISYKVQYD